MDSWNLSESAKALRIGCDRLRTILQKLSIIPTDRGSKKMLSFEEIQRVRNELGSKHYIGGDLLDQLKKPNNSDSSGSAEQVPYGLAQLDPMAVTSQVIQKIQSQGFVAPPAGVNKIGLPEKEEKEGYLYLMYEDGRKYIKIGVTIDVKRREKQLSPTKMPYKVRLLKKIKSRNYKKAEKILHRIYDKYRIDDTEYFDLDPLEVTCLMLLTADHLEDLVSGKIQAVNSLSDVMGSVKHLINDPTESYEDLEMNKQSAMIQELCLTVEDLRSRNANLQNELTRIKVSNITGMAKTENRVRAALKALAVLPTSSDNKN